MLRKTALISLLLLSSTAFSSLAFGVTPEDAEQAEAARWAAAKFSSKIQPVPAENYLSLLGTRGAIGRNSRDGRPLRIFNTEYDRGLYMDGAQGVVVHLTSPAKSFEAVAGLDGSYAGCGYTSATQEFSVAVADKVVFPDVVSKVGTPGIPVEATLDGATEFALKNGQDPEKEWCGDAVWADARVTLEDGTTLWLGDVFFGTTGWTIQQHPAFLIQIRWQVVCRTVEAVVPPAQRAAARCPTNAIHDYVSRPRDGACRTLGWS